MFRFPARGSLAVSAIRWRALGAGLTAFALCAALGACGGSDDSQPVASSPGSTSTGNPPGSSQHMVLHCAPNT